MRVGFGRRVGTRLGGPAEARPLGPKGRGVRGLDFVVTALASLWRI